MLLFNLQPNSASVPVQCSDLSSGCFADLLYAAQVRPLQQRMLAEGESIVVEEVVVNSAVAAPPPTSALQFGGTYLRVMGIPSTCGDVVSICSPGAGATGFA
jgi:hypothetical protein|eukprot:COSAG02_NODE_37457_length_441_cov_1.500000_1_plen_102_part_00